jgi:Domain of unknown function (DUF4440)
MRMTGWLLILACAGLVSARAQEGGEGSVASAVLARENAWSDAESRNDNRALDGIFDNALVYIEGGRLVTKGECLSRVRLAGSHPRQIVAETTTVHIFGRTAIVVGTYREIGVKDGRTLLRQWRFIDTWVNKSGSWMLVAAGAAPLSK